MKWSWLKVLVIENNIS